MGSIICTAGFPSAAIASNCFTARCVSIWYGFFIATLSFFLGRKLPEGYHAFGLRVATFYDLPGIPIAATESVMKMLAELKVGKPGMAFLFPGNCSGFIDPDMFDAETWKPIAEKAGMPG